jgi:hypothetical protein
MSAPPKESSAYAPDLTEPTRTVELFIALSPVRSDMVKTVFLDFSRSKKKLKLTQS